MFLGRYYRFFGDMLFSLSVAFVAVVREEMKAVSTFRSALRAPLLFADSVLGRVAGHRIFTHSDFDPRLAYASWLFLALVLWASKELHVRWRIIFGIEVSG